MQLEQVAVPNLCEQVNLATVADGLDTFHPGELLIDSVDFPDRGYDHELLIERADYKPVLLVKARCTLEWLPQQQARSTSEPEPNPSKACC